MEGRASTQDLTSTSVPVLRATQVPTVREVSARDLQPDNEPSSVWLQLHLFDSILILIKTLNWEIICGLLVPAAFPSLMLSKII